MPRFTFPPEEFREIYALRRVRIPQGDGARFNHGGQCWGSTVSRRSLRLTSGGKRIPGRNHWRESGHWYDYPDCCIEAFVQDWARKLHAGQYRAITNRIRRVKALNMFRFWVPCPRCADVIVDQGVLAYLRLMADSLPQKRVGAMWRMALSGGI